MQTCQWEVPATWDGDPLADMSASDERSQLSGVTGAPTVQSTLSLGVPNTTTAGAKPRIEKHAFEEPGELWIPDDDDQTTSDSSTLGGGSQTCGVHPNAGQRYNSGELPEDVRGPSITLNPDDINPQELITAGGIGNMSQTGATMGTDGSAKDDTDIERIAEKLVESDDLVRVLARRLGLPLGQLVSKEEMERGPMPHQPRTGVGLGMPGSPVTMSSQEKEELHLGLQAPRDIHTEDVQDPEFDSDDELWSDDENEAGDFDADADLGFLPGSHKDVETKRRDDIKELSVGKTAPPSNIPFLNLRAQGVVGGEDNEQAIGWRKLPRPELSTSFYDRCKRKLTMSSDTDSEMAPNKPVFLLPISPVDACAYNPANFETQIESIFIPDAKKDMERSIATVNRNIKREEELSRNLPTDDLLLFGEASEQTHVDIFLAKQYDEDQNAFVDPKEAAVEKAILAAKSNNIAEMEDALEEDIPINAADKYGNSLLILAAQQGSKRMCKFLLRRGADVNAQSLTGNTVLHYCFAYSHVPLAEYLKSRGGDDSIVNLDGLTCYEGLSMDDLKAEGDD
jgi:hypothetical protein